MASQSSPVLDLSTNQSCNFISVSLRGDTRGTSSGIATIATPATSITDNHLISQSMINVAIAENPHFVGLLAAWACDLIIWANFGLLSLSSLPAPSCPQLRVHDCLCLVGRSHRSCRGKKKIPDNHFKRGDAAVIVDILPPKTQS